MVHVAVVVLVSPLVLLVSSLLVCLVSCWVRNKNLVNVFVARRTVSDGIFGSVAVVAGISAGIVLKKLFAHRYSLARRGVSLGLDVSGWYLSLWVC